MAKTPSPWSNVPSAEAQLEWAHWKARQLEREAERRTKREAFRTSLMDRLEQLFEDGEEQDGRIP